MVVMCTCGGVDGGHVHLWGMLAVMVALRAAATVI